MLGRVIKYIYITLLSSHLPPDPGPGHVPMVTSPEHAGTGARLRGGGAGGAVTAHPPPAVTALCPFLWTGQTIPVLSVSLNALLRSTPPCPDGQKPRTCADGSEPERQRGGRRLRCAREEKICCDGSTPSFGGSIRTPPCADGRRPK